ncbi:hypothetical protein ACFV0L_21920 [Streptosporangium canum]|uniref:hypothetical protein n=1 Tax=Streptosporangium canum TaxID=324952 RepID=UPI0036932DA3
MRIPVTGAGAGGDIGRLVANGLAGHGMFAGDQLAQAPEGADGVGVELADAGGDRLSSRVITDPP